MSQEAVVDEAIEALDDLIKVTTEMVTNAKYSIPGVWGPVDGYNPFALSKPGEINYQPPGMYPWMMIVNQAKYHEDRLRNALLEIAGILAWKDTHEPEPEIADEATDEEVGQHLASIARWLHDKGADGFSFQTDEYDVNLRTHKNVSSQMALHGIDKSYTVICTQENLKWLCQDVVKAAQQLDTGEAKLSSGGYEVTVKKVKHDPDDLQATFGTGWSYTTAVAYDFLNQQVVPPPIPTDYHSIGWPDLTGMAKLIYPTYSLQHPKYKKLSKPDWYLQHLDQMKILGLVDDDGNAIPSKPMSELPPFEITYGTPIAATTFIPISTPGPHEQSIHNVVGDKLTVSQVQAALMELYQPGWQKQSPFNPIIPPPKYNVPSQVLDPYLTGTLPTSTVITLYSHAFPDIKLTDVVNVDGTDYVVTSINSSGSMTTLSVALQTATDFVKENTTSVQNAMEQLKKLEEVLKSTKKVEPWYAKYNQKNGKKWKK